MFHVSEANLIIFVVYYSLGENHSGQLQLLYTVKQNKRDAGAQHVGPGKFRHPRIGRAAQSYVDDGFFRSIYVYDGIFRHPHVVLLRHAWLW
jgi:hypothetical protein